MGRYSNLARSDRRCPPEPRPGLGSRRLRPAPRRLSERLTEADRTAIVDDYRAGIRTIQGLADQYQASDYSIRMILRTADIPPRRRKISEDQEQLVVALWTTTALGVDAIAARADMGHANVRLIVAGLKGRAARTV